MRATVLRGRGATRPTPGILARVVRDRFGVLTLVLLGALAIAAAPIATAAQVEITSAIDRNWRGAYDILVRPSNTRLNLESTNGVVEPNFLGFAGRGGISVSQLQKIRDIPGIEVAAPIGFSGYVAYQAEEPNVFIPKNALPENPTLYRLQLEVQSADGLNRIVIHRETEEVLLDPDIFSRQQVLYSGRSLSIDGTADDPEASIDAGFGALPPIISSLMAVDPAAEMELLGPSSGFLEPLLQAEPAQLSTRTFDAGLVPDEFLATKLGLAGLSAPGGPGAGAPARPIVPIIVSTQLYAPLTLKLDVWQVGNALRDYPSVGSQAGPASLAKIQALTGETLRTIGTVTADMGVALRPFQSVGLRVAWPGASLPDLRTISEAPPPKLVTKLAARPTYEQVTPRRSAESPLAFEIQPTGPVNPDGSVAGPVPESGDRAVSIQQTYRRFTDVVLAAATGYREAYPGDRPLFLAPLGTFDLAKLELPDNPLNYVPLGAYDPPDTDLIAQPDGSSIAARAVRPTLNARGLIAVPPLAITDLRGAQLMRGDAPIDAVRVRVGGLATYGEAAVRRVEQIASSIAAMGLDVDIVAGASPQSVEVYVPDYKIRPEGDDRPQDLGWVRQAWTTLGAAERVEQAVGGTSILLLLLSLVAAAIFVVTMQLVRAGTRAREVATFVALGWRRSDVIRWYLPPVAVSALIIIGLGAAAWFLESGGAAGIAASVALVSLLLGAEVQGVLTAWRHAGVASVARGDISANLVDASPTVRGPVTYALRALVIRRVRSFCLASGLVVGSASAGVGLALLTEQLLQAGPTRLAAFAVVDLAIYQWGLLILSAVLSFTMITIMLRHDAADRKHEFQTLLAVGWSGREIRRSLTLQRLVATLPASLLAAVLAAGMCFILFPPSVLFSATVACIVALSAIAWGGLAAERLIRLP